MSAILFALSETIRYEGWIFSATLFATVVVLKWRGKSSVRWREIGLLCFILGPFPLFWIALHIIQLGNPFAFVRDGSTHYDLITTVLKNPLTEFIKVNTLSLNIIGLISVSYFLRHNPRIRILIVVPSIALAGVSSLLLLTLATQSGPSWRIVGVWSMLLLPFTAYLILNPEKLPGNFQFKVC